MESGAVIKMHMKWHVDVLPSKWPKSSQCPFLPQLFTLATKSSLISAFNLYFLSYSAWNFNNASILCYPAFLIPIQAFLTVFSNSHPGQWPLPHIHFSLCFSMTAVHIHIIFTHKAVGKSTKLKIPEYHALRRAVFIFPGCSICSQARKCTQ